MSAVCHHRWKGTAPDTETPPGEELSALEEFTIRANLCGRRIDDANHLELTKKALYD